MSRTFKITNPNGTWAKLGTTKQAESLAIEKKVFLPHGAILTVNDTVKDAGHGHFGLSFEVNLFGEHFTEVKPDRDFSSRAGTIRSIISECRKQGLNLDTQIAYVLATTQWETANTFQPVREAFWKDERWRSNTLRYFPFYGRGYVQLTWGRNYKLYGDILGINLYSNPDLALDPQTACFILVHGFKNGTFTGKKLTDYVNDSKTDFLNARRCINGTDKASEIKDLAFFYLRKIKSYER